MCPKRPVALDPALLFPMRHGSADVQQDLPVHQAGSALGNRELLVRGKNDAGHKPVFNPERLIVTAADHAPVVDPVHFGQDCTRVIEDDEARRRGEEKTVPGSFTIKIRAYHSARSALTTGKNNIDIGNAGTAGESAKIRIGNKAHKNTYIAGISGVTIAGGVGVIIDTTGHLGTVVSSARYKKAIQPS
jgi:hypothetical protein